MIKLTRGFLLSVEGGDCCGKTTSLEILKERFQLLGYEVESFADLYSTPMGDIAHSAFLGHGSELDPMSEALLIFAARVENIQKNIVPALRAGKIVILDRFTDSTFVYQGVIKGLGENTIGILETLCQGSLRPDRSILLHSDIDTVMERLSRKKNKDKHELMPREFFEKIEAGFMSRVINNRSRFTVVSSNNGIEDMRESLDIVVNDIHQSLKLFVKDI